MTAHGPDFHTISLWRQPPNLLREYEKLKHLDPLFVESASQPGIPVRATARTGLPKAFRSYTRRFGLEQAMSTIYTDPRSALLTGVTSWRNSRTSPFTVDDAAIEAVFPHLMEVSSRHALRVLDGSPAARAGGPPPTAAAACTAPTRRLPPC